MGTHLPTRARYIDEDARSDAGAGRLGLGPADPPAVVETEASPVAQADGPVPVDADDASLEGGPASYVVQPGDSLWSIAKRLLGRDASAGRIAREVNRLWSLNRSRIATGDPDLLMVGTRLELR